jgi:hypothetical protein
MRLNRLAISGMVLFLSSRLMACNGDSDSGGGSPSGGSGASGASGASGGIDASGGSRVDAGANGVECAPFAPCGGDIIGDWSFEDVCGEATESPIEGCPEAASDYSGMSVTGTVAFEVNGSYSVSYDTAGDLVISLPRSCLPDALTCDALSDDGSTCTPDGSNCRCVISLVDHVDHVGEWETSGSVVTLDGEQSPFCVAGDSLELRTETDGSALTFKLTRK